MNTALHDYYNFSYIVPDKLAGMSLPDEDSIRLLQEEGIKGILSLTEEPLPVSIQNAFEYYHIPIPDFAAPDTELLRHAVETVNRVHGKVVVHCFAGLGRTGTVLAAYLVSQGMSGNDAIALVRNKRPYSIETTEQELSIVQFEIDIHGNTTRTE